MGNNKKQYEIVKHTLLYVKEPAVEHEFIMKF